MKIAIHQPNFIPWFPYFLKMHKADVFVLLTECQFEKNGYQNRARIHGRWWTIPVKGGLMPIKDKVCMTGRSLVVMSKLWIYAIAETLGIDTKKIQMDFPTEKRGTERLIEICRHYNADTYLTNPDAKDKYLDEDAMRKAGIKIEYVDTPYKKSVFELFNESGIEGTIRLLEKEIQSSNEKPETVF